MYKFFIIVFFISAIFAQGPIDIIPKDIKIDKDKALLGKFLFFDPNLSKDKIVSCASCHKKEFGGSNGKEKGLGVFGRKTLYNVPSIYNLKYQYIYGWEKKKYSLKSKIEEVMENQNIMDADFKKIVEYIKNNSFLRRKFFDIYKKVDKDSIIDALYNYLLTLNTPDSKFDLYLKGKVKLNKDELKGFELFKKLGCIACHNGKAIGGHLYFKYGYFLKSDKQKYIKCPSLRNIALTSPYFHHGKIKSLKEAVKWMAKAQLGKDITDDDAEKIVKFLKTLTGKLDDKVD